MFGRVAIEVIAGRRFGSILAAVLVAGLYLVWATTVAFDENPTRLALIGDRFLRQGSGESTAIDRLKGEAVDDWGYDGQFALYIALAPLDAESYIDNPAYRYGRVFYPLLTSALAAGHSDATPYVLVLVNIAAAIALTFALARLLERNGVSAWYALLAGLAPGLAVAVMRDLVEPVAYALTAIAVLVLVGHGGRWRVVPAGIVFMLAALTRETTLLFPLAAAAALALGTVEAERDVPAGARARRALTLLGIASVPLLLLKVILATMASGVAVPSGVRSERLPFWGVLWDSNLSESDIYQLRNLVAPALLAILVVGLAVRRPRAPVLALMLNVLVLVVFLPRASYEHYLTSSRIMLGVIVAFVLCIPLLPPRWRLALVVPSAVLWLEAWESLLNDFTGL